MQLVTGRRKAKVIYSELAEKGVAMLAPCCESAGDIEGILVAAQRFAEKNGIERIPINIGFTGSYPEYPMLKRISVSCKINRDGLNDDGDVVEGFDMLMGYLRAHADLKSSDRVFVLPFFDHGQLPTDGEMLEKPERLMQLAVVLVDNSYCSLDENIERTREYVEKFRGMVLVEGVVDRIYTKQQAFEYGITRDKMITTVDDAVRYVEETGVDFIVPNLGTEHRVTSERDYVKKYESRRAREITKAVGKKICLHGTSCLGDAVETIANDGIIKVNVYTRMCVESGIRVYQAMEENERAVLVEKKLEVNSPAFRNYHHREKVAEVITSYLEALNYKALAR